MVETKEVYFNDRPPETRFYWHASLCITAWSNIRIFEDKSRIRLDKPMDTYGLRNPRFVIEYSNIRIRPSQNALHWAQFFDKIFQAVLEVIFGFGNEDKIGILGEVAAYYFIIEAQGKGTLHSHGLI